MAYFLLALLGIGLVAAFSGENDAQQDETADDIPMDEEPVTGDRFIATSDDDIIGTAGNDTIEANPDNDGSFSPFIDAGDGDDEVIVSGGYMGTVQGGAGNDVITSQTVSELSGGDGNDTLLGSGFETLHGGAGDDLLVLGERGAADGGLGEDTLRVRSQVGDGTVQDIGATWSLTGGEGADLFEVGLTVFRSETQPFANNFDTTGISVTDFTPGEDRLIVEIERDTSANPDGFSRVELLDYGRLGLEWDGADARLPLRTSIALNTEPIDSLEGILIREVDTNGEVLREWQPA